MQIKILEHVYMGSKLPSNPTLQTRATLPPFLPDTECFRLEF